MKLFWYVIVLVLLCDETTTNASEIQAVIVFGDSVVDAGNNNNIVASSAKSNHPPYGIDFEGGIATGRFSNAKVPTDIIAEKLGIKQAIPAYLDPNLKPEELLTGVTFASGGAGYLPVTTKIAGGITVTQQLKLFEQYLEKLKVMVGEERTQDIIENSLFVVVCGSNDITYTYFGLPPHVQMKYDIDSFTTLLADNARSFTQKLYEYGARRIHVYGVTALGCVPSQRTIAGGPPRNCVDRFNDGAKLYNAKLQANLDSLSKTLNAKQLSYIDNYDSLLDIIMNPQQYGFKVVDRGCCGTGLIEVIGLCNSVTAPVCPKRTDYVFWDSFHPTEKAYRIMVAKNWDKVF